MVDSLTLTIPMVLCVVFISVGAWCAGHYQDGQQYKSGKEAFAEWLLLDTCMETVTEQKKNNPDMDAGDDFFNCVQEAKKNHDSN